MRQFVFILFIFMSVLHVCAQNNNVAASSDETSKAKADSVLTDSSSAVDTVALSEVVVRGSRVRNNSDALRIVPTLKQKETSTNVYSLLSKMALPGVIVDEVQRSVSVPASLGTLQVRINDVVASNNDFLSLDMASIKHIDYIRNPGARYGTDVDFVINIVTRRAVSGYVLGAGVGHSVTAKTGSGNMFAKLNHGKSEFAVDYSFSYSDLRKTLYEEDARYVMPDNSVFSIQRRDKDAQKRTLTHDLQLRYSLADEGRYVLQTTLGGNLYRRPKDFVNREMTTNGKVQTLPINSTDRTSSPFLDLYFNASLTERQTLTASATASYVKSDYSYRYSGQQPYAYSTVGSTWALASELIYENRLKPFTLSFGLQYNQKFVANTYSGDAGAANSIRNSSEFLFAQIKGNAFSLSYLLSAGLSRQYYRQASSRYEYWLFSPRLTLSYPMLKNFLLKYSFSMTRVPPRIGYLGDVSVRTNEMEITAGNPSLHPNIRVEHTFTVSFQKPSFYTELQAFWRGNSDCVMQEINREADSDGNTVFVFTRKNQDRCNLLYISNYTTYDILPEKLSLTATAGFSRCFNFGNTYRHHYSAFTARMSLTAYLGRFTFTGNIDSGWGFLEGEMKSEPCASYNLTAQYKIGDFDISLLWSDCFMKNKTMFSNELLNRYVHKSIRYISGDYANMIRLSVSWRFSKGRKYSGTKRNVRLKDTDTGVVKTL